MAAMNSATTRPAGTRRPRGRATAPATRSPTTAASGRAATTSRPRRRPTTTTRMLRRQVCGVFWA